MPSWFILFYETFSVLYTYMCNTQVKPQKYVLGHFAKFISYWGL